MTARLIHVGEDHWHRLQVLRAAGLAVEQCADVQGLQTALRTGTDPGAILLAASPFFDPAPAAKVVRSAAKCPVILFSVASTVHDPDHYDLVIHPLTDPSEWLDSIWTIIGKSEQIRSESRAIRKESQELRKQSEAARQRSSEQRERVKRLMRRDGAERSDGEHKP